MPTLTRNVQGLFDTVTNDFVGVLDPVTRTEYYFEVQKGGSYPASIIQLTLLTNDGTAKSAVAVPAAGNFVITTNAATTGITKVGFLVIN